MAHYQHKTTERSATLQPPSSKLQSRELHAQRTSGTAKRARVATEEDEERERKRQARNEGARHLERDYDVPESARAINVPQTREEEEGTRRVASNMTVKIRGGAYKPIDTLSVQRHSAGSGNKIQGSTTKAASTKRMSQTSSLELQRSKGANVRSVARVGADGFSNDHNPPTKKLKDVNGNAARRPSKPDVDLTNDDSQRDCIELPSPAKRTTRDSVANTSSQTTSWSDQTVFSRIEGMTRRGPEKAKRKNRGSQGSSQSSHRATPNGVQATLPSGQHMAKPLRLDLTVGNELDDEVQGVRTPGQGRSNKPRVPPRPIDGTPVQASKDIGRDSEEDHAASHNVLLSLARDKLSKPRSYEQNPEEQQTDSVRPRRRIIQPVFTSIPHTDEQSHDGDDLRNKFVRIESDATTQPKPSRTRVMQAESNMVKGRTGLGSEDELAGASTMTNRASRSASPKNRRQGPPGQKGDRVVTRDIKRSTPDLAPTRFYSASQQASKQVTQKKKVEQFDEDTENDRIPIRKILCRSCCLQQNNLELVWEPGQSGFVVECGGSPQQIPNKHRLLSLGPREVHQWTDANKNGSLAVHLKGAKTENSSGGIIVEFEDNEGLAACFNAFMDVTGEKLKVRTESKSRMEAIVKTQSAVIVEDHKKNLKPTHHDAELAIMQKRHPGRGIRQPSDDKEEIIYEDDPAQSHQSRRNRMQANHSSEDQASRTRSKFFMGEIEPERRSSRQRKPVKPKSPTPPPLKRWTHENKIERWSHSVVYPPEGSVRRVTVDFQDLERLDEGEFLNDNIINFALRRIEENMAPEYKDHVLFFNTFFYTALTNKTGKKGFNYDAVKRWTKSMDLFSFPYVVVPINIDLHWFVAIICNLSNLSRKVAGIEDEQEDDDMLLEGREHGSEANDELRNGMAAGRTDATTTDAQNSMRNLSLSDQESESSYVKKEQAHTPDDTDKPPNGRTSTSSVRKSKKKAPPRQRTFDTEGPSIVTLDSFGSGHSVEIKFLKEYVSAEADAKRGMAVTKEDLQGVNANGIPLQTNFCDCGVYLVGYIEEFAKNPKKFKNRALRRQFDKDNDFAGFDPSAKRAELRDELLKLQKEQDADRRAKKIAKRVGATINGEADKAGVTNRSADVQANNEISTASLAKATQFVPLLDTQESIKSHNDEIEGREVASDADKSDVDGDLEAAVPRALPSPRVIVPKNNAAFSTSSHTKPSTNPTSELANETDHSNATFDQPVSDGKPENSEGDLLTGIVEYLSDGLNAPQLQQNQTNASRKKQRSGSTPKQYRKEAGRRGPPVRSAQDVIDLDDEKERGPVIPDSQ